MESRSFCFVVHFLGKYAETSKINDQDVFSILKH